MSVAPLTRPSLLLRLRDRGNHEAWSEFLELYEPVIYRIAKRRQMQDADAREIVQEVLLRVARAIDRFDPDTAGSFRGWLSQTTRRVTVDRFRRMANRESAIGGPTDLLSIQRDPVVDQLQSEFDCQQRRQLFHCAAQHVQSMVSDTAWQSFWQTAVENRTADEVAARLGTSPGAIYVARCRVLKRIREFIEQREAD
ncbi:sigma-70 family RNA polymerase sigma factor [Stieleria sp. TO1_6]|uniref:RNA polymerase sigma factor n=1 Tax=Stieleria tagensis TaxID=2956795 RepID=UPI00209B04ED|nr:sigma-70 family RNA polymerase sigma factor [Stieleria tagensis]MCO8124132.1 sigma-70 family RNA polymerase sigma factor [Stieleria tagensis]